MRKSNLAHSGLEPETADQRADALTNELRTTKQFCFKVGS